MIKIKTAIITGASSGIGAEYTRQLAQMNCDLILVARRKEKLEALVEELVQKYGINRSKIDIFVADLSVQEDIMRLSKYIESKPDLDLLINNAGFGIDETFPVKDLKRQMDMITVHVTATVQLTNSALLGMIQRKHGYIINVSSVAAFYPMPGNITYSSTKCYLTYFSEGIQNEILGNGIYIQALCPGFTVTEFHQNLQRDRYRPPRLLWMQSQDVVNESLKSLESGKVIIVPGIMNKVVVFLMQLYLVRIIMRIFFKNKASKQSK